MPNVKKGKDAEQKKRVLQYFTYLRSSIVLILSSCHSLIFGTQDSIPEAMFLLDFEINLFETHVIYSFCERF